ncbi:hypothetical protein THTE_1335 [Thermogutta terrifontis]|uniref:Uncharacterized protein n=1 Tax=Thermogutta terrifontis TaxID=1331910 RepID=A0A286RDC2_9BACT|nr:hypothetical protein THTE_1335 [Thermogutta terrifontis]
MAIHLLAEELSDRNWPSSHRLHGKNVTMFRVTVVQHRLTI